MPFGKRVDFFKTIIVLHFAHMLLFENPNPSDRPPSSPVFIYKSFFQKKGKNVAIVRYYFQKIPQSLTPTIDIIMQKRHSTTEMAKAPSATMIIFALMSLFFF